MPAALADRARPGDVILTLGAGDVTALGPRVLELLEVLCMKADNVARSRKRFARRQRTRRWRRWRAVLAGTLTVALGVGVVWLVFFSTVLAVKGVEIEGTSLLTTDEVRSVAAVPSDEPLARVDLAAIEGRLRALAPVRSVDATREWPDRILISIDERVEVAVVEVGSGFKGIDQEGVLFRDFPKRPRDLPLITAPEDIGTDAMKEGTARGVRPALGRPEPGRPCRGRVDRPDLTRAA